MSYIFTVSDTDEDFWQPALAVGQLFMGGVNALGTLIIKVPTGLDDITGDRVKIDTALYGEFVTAALRRRGRTTHSELMKLMDGLLPVMVMLADKSGAKVTASTLAERAYLEWARDEDRVVKGHVSENRHGTVSVWKSRAPR
ncbi:hypothetical protein I2W78_11475 [Streptomyces spinoverrucosus]|uniref:DUF6086 family protein n=1 Tax=Streptomyces spinoverrucosus TaxID=284043 RepID=UPI0018C3920A|nr:DUF6086 family protein [Streptomyces spinoverrucosus]MBG0852437.1 hypothetical protein [Streptomyces spinoverrucosus]